jgi:CubicO group peptidase (beta-lactamase class C family)
LPESGLGQVGEIIARAVADGGVPGVVAAAGRGPSTLGSWVAGQADTTAGAARPMRYDTVFDLASLTKVVATTTVTLALAGAGSLGLDDAVRGYLPRVRWDVTIRDLLTHTSGLPTSVKYYEWCSSREPVLRALFGTPLEAPPGTRVVYSDLGFMTLGEIVAAVTGSPLDVVFRELVASPLAMTDTEFNPAGVPAGGFAATEPDADGKPWTGVVHDENARVMGGVAGHAGLFGCAADLARFAAWWVSPDDGPVPVVLRHAATSCQTPGLGGRRGLGWARAGDRYDILGPAWPSSAVSHTGFTGTSIALDPVSGVWVVLLTNGVHYGRGRPDVKALRLAIHAAVADALLALPVKTASQSTRTPGRWRRGAASRPRAARR